MQNRLRVLFLCVHNSARSQMAEGLLRSIAADRFEVFSAGSEPTFVNPFAIRVLRDQGIDISHQDAKSIKEFAKDRFDYVITLCAEEECPLFLGEGQRLHWGLPDPAAVAGSSDDKAIAFRQVAVELRIRIGQFVAECSEDHTSPHS
jgi:arsenate reductase (thioredoxin)